MKFDIVTESFDILDATSRIQWYITEADEAPRWKFDYATHKIDPSPDVLILGDWVHPNTGNYLIGGINLHYLDTNQRDSLAKILPELMKQTDLYDRYWTGRKLLPYVFQNYYRTYNANNMASIDKDVFYPKYGYTKAAYNWVKDRLAALVKSKKQLAQDKLPKYPSDLSGIPDRLEQAVKKAVRAAGGGVPEAPAEKPTAEPSKQQKRAENELLAKKAIAQKQKETNIPEPTPNINDIDIPDTADVSELELQQAKYEKEHPDEFEDQELEVQDQQIQQSLDQKRQQQNLARQEQLKQDIEQQEIKKAQEVKQRQQQHDQFMKDVERNREDNLELGESIRYYSPIKKKYIIEHI